MEISSQIHGTHAVASPSGQYIASIANEKLLISSVHVPERCTDVPIRVPAKDVSALKWSSESNRIAVLSSQILEVIDLDDGSHRIRIDNGSGGLGRFSSAEFVGQNQLLVVWEFGKAKLWDLSTGKGIEIGDIKTVGNGLRWQNRPCVQIPSRTTLATLSRPGADDILNVYLPTVQKQISSMKIPTTDAQSLSWSPDGRWLAILDTPTIHPSVHFHTPDGHHFRSYPPADETDSSALSAKAGIWSGNSQIFALTRYDGRIVLLNTRTFAPLAVIEHSAKIDQRLLPVDQQAPIWQEAVSGSGERSYASMSQPFSPPLSKIKPSTEPNELGVAEARFSCDGSYLATRDERMLNTVWIWNMAALSTQAVLTQHSNVRKLHWHPTRTDELMADCGEGIAYTFNVSSANPPTLLSTSMSGTSNLSWIPTSTVHKPAILATTKSSFRLVYPEGALLEDEMNTHQALSGPAGDESFEEGDTEDSLYDVLSGRKPLPPRTEQSYTERIDIEVETEEEESTMRVDDTFRDVKVRKAVVDPLDDSQIF